MYQSRGLFELCFRADEGLPLPARPLARFLIRAAIARTQRDNKVILCNQVWMGNHPHLSLVSQDVAALMRFYGELKKRLTDMIKRLLGLEKLSLWPSQPTVIQILDLEKAKERVGYGFLNPARAALVDSIDEFPGESSWDAFVNAEPSVDAKIVSSVPWIRLPSIPVLSRPNPSAIEEQRVIEELKANNKEQERLEYYPFAWLKVFGITDPEDVARIRDEIVARVRGEEQEIKRERIRAGKGILGRQRLLQEGIAIKGHKPKKHGPKIFFLSSVFELRQGFLSAYRRFCEECRECYLRACAGARDVVWPPGAFIPPIPPLVNPI